MFNFPMCNLQALKYFGFVFFQDRRRMQALHPGPASQNGFHLTSHRQLDTDEIQSHVRSVLGKRFHWIFATTLCRSF